MTTSEFNQVKGAACATRKSPASQEEVEQAEPAAQDVSARMSNTPDDDERPTRPAARIRKNQEMTPKSDSTKPEDKEPTDDDRPTLKRRN